MTELYMYIVLLRVADCLKQYTQRSHKLHTQIQTQRFNPQENNVLFYNFKFLDSTLNFSLDFFIAVSKVNVSSQSDTGSNILKTYFTCSNHVVIDNN